MEHTTTVMARLFHPPDKLPTHLPCRVVTTCYYGSSGGIAVFCFFFSFSVDRETIHFSSSSVIFFLVPKFGCDTHAATIYRRNRVLDQVHIIPNHPAILTRFASIRGDKKKRCGTSGRRRMFK